MSATVSPISAPTAANVAKALRASGKAFNGMLALCLVAKDKKASDAVDSVIVAVCEALEKLHITEGKSLPAKVRDKALQIDGYKTAINYASLLRKAVKLGNDSLELIQGAYNDNLTVAQFAQALRPVKSEESAEAPAPAEAPAEESAEAPAEESAEALKLAEVLAKLAEAEALIEAIRACTSIKQVKQLLAA